MPPPLRCASIIPSPSVCAKQYYRTSQSRTFSSTSPQNNQRRPSRNRRAMLAWLNTVGTAFRDPMAGSTNYLGAYTADGKLRRRVLEEADGKEAGTKEGFNDAEKVNVAIADMGPDGPKGPPGAEAEKKQLKQRLPSESNQDLRPFPLNPDFRSQPVLGEELRERIWESVMVDGKSVRDVSAALSVEMSRVGAVVRLMEIEKEWKRIGKPLARPYAKAVMSMLPVTSFDANTKTGGPYQPHESINDLPLHSATNPQIFYPTSESRHFTRADAAKVFDEKLLPADDRVPHPELALMHKDFLVGLPKNEIEAKQAERDAEVEKNKEHWRQKQAKKLAKMKVIDSPRWAFRITPVNVDDIGQDGRGAKGVGWRYGMPLMDRSRAQHKIPRRAGL